MWNSSKVLLFPKRQYSVLNISSSCRDIKDDLARATSGKKHNLAIYKNEGSFQSRTLLAKHLKENIVYDDSKKSGLVVVNKPFGLSLLPGETNEISLTCALPELASYLEVSNISVIKSCGRSVSGCTLLNAGGEKTLKHVSKCVSRNRNNRKLGTKYLAITNGIPRTSGVLETVDVSLETIKTKKSLKGGDWKEPVIHRELVSQTKLRKGNQYGKKKDLQAVKMNRISVIADILAKSRGNSTALVSIQPTDIQWNFLSAYMANLLSPILGDSQFSYRVKTLFGKPIKVSHENSPVGHISNDLSRLVLGQLGMTSADEDNLPLHIHHFRTHLSGFFGKEDLNVYSPTPKYFDHTLNSLEIVVNFESLKKLDEIKEHSLPKRKDRKNKQTSET